ncbi:Phosphatidylinositol glycan anchor biosynthesis class U protein [Teratosphaeria destructans]|uniref:Phosphatidylinositol glycan anchor biosynthesis class U protein n=1 Tax=Teratosphaeria destructans TaxID=418781 RepID=A0A9W7SYJ7_9PEZI|nr:Phosphatidylinositol glycan anchor biosynthesis class U protein [Teratosphaeria destructans]
MDVLTTTYNEHPKTIVFASAAAFRILLALAFPGLPDALTARVEISTPVNSFERLQEGLFLYERGLDPYDGGVFHQAPLLLPLFSFSPSPSTWIGRLISVLLYTGLDILAANSLHSIVESGASFCSRLYISPRKDRAWKPISVAAVYLFNPFTLLSCLGRPTTVFTTFFTLLSISHACQAQGIPAMFALAIASYISLHPLLLLPPICMLCFDRVSQSQAPTSRPEWAKTAIGNADQPKAGTKVSLDQRSRPQPLPVIIQLLVAFVAFAGFLIGLSRLLLPSWKFLASVYMTPLVVTDLTPNPGLWWYFFVEMFDAFREFFLGVFWLHMLSYSIPFCLRFHKQPLAAVVLMMGIVAVFQPYANVGDAGAWLSCSALLSHTFGLSSSHRYTFPALATLLYTTLLGPAFHHLWIYAGSGNANFFYAITLVWSLALLVLLTDTVYSVLRDEWESERPEAKGKYVRQI